MKKLLYVALSSLMFCACDSAREEQQVETNQTIEDFNYDFDETTCGFDSSEEIAKGVMQFLKTGDTASYLKMAIPLDAQKYLFQQNFSNRPDIGDPLGYIKRLENRFEGRMKNFITQTIRFKNNSTVDSVFNFETCSIDSIQCDSIGMMDYRNMNRPLIAHWAPTTVYTSSGNQQFELDIPFILQLKGKWFLYLPNYNLKLSSQPESSESVEETKSLEESLQ